MPFSLSERSACVVRSEIRNMSLECDRAGGINLSQGICDTPVPEQVRRAARFVALQMTDEVPCSV